MIHTLLKQNEHTTIRLDGCTEHSTHNKNTLFEYKQAAAENTQRYTQSALTPMENRKDRTNEKERREKVIIVVVIIILFFFLSFRYVKKADLWQHTTSVGFIFHLFS